MRMIVNKILVKELLLVDIKTPYIAPVKLIANFYAPNGQNQIGAFLVPVYYSHPTCEADPRFLYDPHIWSKSKWAY